MPARPSCGFQAFVPAITALRAVVDGSVLEALALSASRVETGADGLALAVELEVIGHLGML